MINTLQIINYSAMMTLYYPKIVSMLFSFTGIVNIENEYLSKLYLVHINTTVLDERESWDYRFKNQGIENTNILIN